MTNAIFVLIVSVSLKSIPCKLTLFSLRIRWKWIKISCNLIRELCCYLLRLDETMKAESNLNKANKCWIHSIVSAKACAYWWMNQNAIHYNGMKLFCNLQHPKSIVRRTKLESRRFQNENDTISMHWRKTGLHESISNFLARVVIAMQTFTLEWPFVRHILRSKAKCEESIKR